MKCALTFDDSISFCGSDDYIERDRGEGEGSRRERERERGEEHSDIKLNIYKIILTNTHKHTSCLV